MAKAIDLLDRFEREVPDVTGGGIPITHIYPDTDSFERWALLACHVRGEPPPTDAQLRQLRSSWRLDKPN
jgi:hypothetical protein